MKFMVGCISEDKQTKNVRTLENQCSQIEILKLFLQYCKRGGWF